MEKRNNYSSFRWFVLLVMVLVTASTSLILIAPTTVVGPIAKSVGVGIPVILTITMSIFNVFMAISAIGGGQFIDKLGFVKIYIICLTMVVCGNLVILIAGKSVAGIFVARLLQGLGTGPIMASIVLVAREWFNPKEHGIVTGLQGLAVSLGTTVAFLLVPQLLKVTGNWQSAIAILSIINIVCIILTLVVMFGPKPSIIVEEQSDELEDSKHQDAGFKMMQAAVIAGALCIFIVTWLQLSINTIGPQYIGSEMGKGEMLGSQYMSYYALAFVIGCPLSGVISAVFFKGNGKPIIILGFVLSAVFCAALTFKGIASSSGLLIITLLGAGLLQSLINPQVMAFIAKSYPKNVIGKVSGFSMGLGFLAGVIGPAVSSFSMSITGSYKMAFYIMSVISILGILLAFYLKVVRNVNTSENNDVAS